MLAPDHLAFLLMAADFWSAEQSMNSGKDFAGRIDEELSSVSDMLVALNYRWTPASHWLGKLLCEDHILIQAQEILVLIPNSTQSKAKALHHQERLADETLQNHQMDNWSPTSHP